MEKMNIKVDAEVSIPGDAMTLLRQTAEMINRGHRTGPGWSLGEGAQNVERSTIESKANARLDELTDALGIFLQSEEISDDEIRVEFEQMLPQLYEELRNAGFGSDLEENEVQNDTESVEKGGDGTKVETEENDQPGAPGQATQDAAVVGEATVAANDDKKPSKPWFLGGVKK